MTAVGLAFEAWIFIPGFQLLTVFGLLGIGLGPVFKEYNLWRRVRDGTLPVWTAYWNQAFFGPKGLVVGFDMAGPGFDDAEVEPEPRQFFLLKRLRGPFKSPVSKRRAAKKPRISIAFIDQPRPQAGCQPEIRTKTSWFQRSM